MDTNTIYIVIIILFIVFVVICGFFPIATLDFFSGLLEIIFLGGCSDDDNDW